MNRFNPYSSGSVIGTQEDNALLFSNEGFNPYSSGSVIGTQNVTLYSTKEALFQSLF
ncbi:MAG: hypothetical protein CI947_2253 [Halanaerobium sp.]|nr:MAG: hypothetical protein CI947_2253 [Halanaerobium sp.]